MKHGLVTIRSQKNLLEALPRGKNKFTSIFFRKCQIGVNLFDTSQINASTSLKCEAEKHFSFEISLPKTIW